MKKLPEIAQCRRRSHRGEMTLFWHQNNWQGLTKEDHDRKTAIEDFGFGRVTLAQA